MKGAEVCDTIVRHETSFSAHVGRDLDPDASPASVVCEVTGVEDIGS